MLGWLLWGLIIDAAAGAICIVVSFLNKKRSKEELRNRNIKKATVRDIVKDPSVIHIKLDGIDEDGNEVDIQIDTQEYDSSEIKRGAVILV